jgi:helix-turn-helix protein
MSDGEQALADTKGKFVQVVSEGRKVADLEWMTGRLVLSNKRLVLASSEGKETLVLSNVTSVTNRKHADNAIAPGSGYFTLQVDADVYLIAPTGLDEFEQQLYTALLDQAVILVKHPALRGGVVQDTDWGKARLSVAAGGVDLALASGQFVEVEVADVGGAAVTEKTVSGSTRPVLEVEHTVGDGTSVETHISGSARHVAILESLVSRGGVREAEAVELADRERQVLMALYSGVSPFEIPDFVGMDVDEVEDIFDRLCDKGVLAESRVRREVRLKARGRNIASEVISDQ